MAFCGSATSAAIGIAASGYAASFSRPTAFWRTLGSGLARSAIACSYETCAEMVANAVKRNATDATQATDIPEKSRGLPSRGIRVRSPFGEHWSEISTGMRGFDLRELLGRSGRDNRAAVFAAFGTEVDDVVGG